MSKVNFYRGYKNRYDATVHADGIFFAKDTKEIILDGDIYSSNCRRGRRPDNFIHNGPIPWNAVPGNIYRFNGRIGKFKVGIQHPDIITIDTSNVEVQLRKRHLVVATVPLDENIADYTQQSSDFSGRQRNMLQGGISPQAYLVKNNFNSKVKCSISQDRSKITIEAHPDNDIFGASVSFKIWWGNDPAHASYPRYIRRVIKNGKVIFEIFDTLPRPMSEVYVPPVEIHQLEIYRASGVNSGEKRHLICQSAYKVEIQRYRRVRDRKINLPNSKIKYAYRFTKARVFNHPLAPEFSDVDCEDYTLLAKLERFRIRRITAGGHKSQWSYYRLINSVAEGCYVLNHWMPPCGGKWV